MIRILFVNAVSDRDSAELLKTGIKRGLETSQHLKKLEKAIELVSFDCLQEGGRCPSEMYDFAKSAAQENPLHAVILSGSKKNTTDKDDPWVAKYLTGLKALLNYSESSETPWAGPRFPTLGICFGHQAIAVALGGETKRFKRNVALLDLEILEAARTHELYARLLENKKELNVLVTHSDHVIQMPPGFKQTFRSDYCEIQGMVHEKFQIASLQSHPEITEEFSKSPHGLEGWKNIDHEKVKDHQGPYILGAFLDWATKSLPKS